ncbi:unnamed protein product [Sphagnum troendelagicum]
MAIERQGGEGWYSQDCNYIWDGAVLTVLNKHRYELLACFLLAVYEYAFTLVHQLDPMDPMSEGRDVLQLKTGLSSMTSLMLSQLLLYRGITSSPLDERGSPLLWCPCRRVFRDLDSMNVDDAMDDMFCQIRGVSDDLQGVLKTATIGLRYPLPLGNSSSGEMTMSQIVTNSASLSDDEDHMESDYSSVHGFGSGDWQSDSDLHVDTHEADGSKPSSHRFGLPTLDDRDNLYFGRHFDRALSEGHSPVDSCIFELLSNPVVYEILLKSCNLPKAKN